MQGASSNDATFSIGGVSLAVSQAPDSPFIPAVPPVRGVDRGADSQPQLAALRWMMQKVHMKQDMFLLGPPGPLLRHTVFRFCELFRREMEYVGITRDTSEADLKQRCEIRGGTIEYVDQAPVRAALHGRVLVLEGIEKAERNVLPLLNNLLENREMALEDRRFLLAPQRAEQLRAQGAPWAERLVPVHPDFIVVALGMPGRGNPLDPPLRSRFAAFAVSPTLPSDSFGSLVQAAPSVSISVVQRLCTAVGALVELAADGGRGLAEPLKVPVFPEGGLGGAVRLLECFPELDLMAALSRAYPFVLMPQLNDRQRVVLAKALEALRNERTVEYSLVSVHCEDGDAVLSFAGGAGGSEAAKVRAPAGQWMKSAAAAHSSTEEFAGARGQEDGELAKLKALSIRDLKAWLSSRNIQHSDCFEKSDLLRRAEEKLSKEPRGPPRPRGVLSRPISGLTLSASQAATLSAMLADHVAGVDMCVVGEKGVGKSVLVRAFANLLGYRSRTIFCYKDMASRDLLQRRTTDPSGNTEWRDSPLVEAALKGELAVLDGVQRLAPGTLYSTLGPLLSDREATLPDGSRLASPRRWGELLRRHGAEALAASAVRPVHPAFRCIACGEPPSATEAWLDDEVATLFHFHPVRPLPSTELLALLAEPGAPSDARLERLCDCAGRMRRAAAADAHLAPLQLSLRVLLRAAAHLRQRHGDVAGALDRAFSACLRFLPPASRDAAVKLLEEAGGKATSTPQRSATQSQHSDGVVTIGDVSCPMREPQRPELVPEVAFVEIPAHVAALRDMLLDWSLGRHLLLVGNQGVGKNKLADRLLCLLRCEREYVQLHRDTTVQSLTLAPGLEDGKVVWEDSPLVRAARAGRCLVVDEADKAPLEVVCVLKALAEDGELALPDGRTIVREDDWRLQSHAEDVIAMGAGFRMIVLANRPGLPFLGNDFFRVCGDVFSCHAIDNPDMDSEVALLRSVGPDVPRRRVVQLSRLFTDLRSRVEAGKLAYPYSTRELVKLIAHVQQFPDDDLEQVAADVFAFDMADGPKGLMDVLKSHGIGASDAGEAALAGGNRGQRGYTLEQWCDQ